MFLLRHGEQFVVAYLHIAKADKDKKNPLIKYYIVDFIKILLT